MSKRFTDTDKWKKPFIRGLQGAYKLLWFYILDDCDHAGIWQVDFEVARLKIGVDVESDIALQQFGDRVHSFSDGQKWFIPDFIEFQYGDLNPENRAHSAVIFQLKKYNLMGLISPLEGRKDKDKEKEKDKDSLGKSENPFLQTFDAFRKIYPGTKRGNQTEFENFCKKHKDWKEVLPLLALAVEKQVAWRSTQPADAFVPPWKNMQTWINQRCWEEVVSQTHTTQERPAHVYPGVIKKNPNPSANDPNA